MTEGDPDTWVVAAHCLDRLRATGATVSTAESLTAGLLSAALAAVPGASDVLRGGVVAYASEVKTSLLAVDQDLVETYGVVSGECALAMARGARDALGSTWALATTGVAGPDRQEDKAVGTVYVAVVGPELARSRALALTGERQRIRDATVAEALGLLSETLAG